MSFVFFEGAPLNIILSNFRAIFFRLETVLLALLILAPLACRRDGTGLSELAIREGARVEAASLGPERVSTVALLFQSAFGYSEACSAALIGPRRLATAGHCAIPGVKLAFFGTDLGADDAETWVVPIKSIKRHEKYGSERADGLPVNDVAIVTLADDAPDFARPIKILPDSAEIPEESTVRLAGFGITESGSGAGVLRSVDTTFVGLDAQKRLLIDDDLKRGACSGDSGGPLYALHGGEWYVAGVLSGGPIPGRGVNVYTSLQVHREFVSK